MIGHAKDAAQSRTGSIIRVFRNYFSLTYSRPEKITEKAATLAKILVRIPPKNLRNVMLLLST